MFRDKPQMARVLQPDGRSHEGFFFEPTGLSTGIEPPKQPQATYTTVGSVYNPKASTPLHPPTRRPRTRRYPQPIRSPSGGILMPFPEALLSALPLKDQHPPSPPTTASVLRQYSVLQQNDERAVSPAAEQGNIGFTGYAISTPSMRSEDLPSPTEFGGSGSSAAENTLTSRITVKGLTNLASYPNPMQKAAQNTLARARTANLDLSRPDTPSSLPSTTPDPYKDQLFNPYGAAPITTGGPQPLTAGPPGQRSFRPMTLEAVSRPIQVEDLVRAVAYPSKTPIGLQHNIDSSILTTSDIEGIGGRGRSTQLHQVDRQLGPVSRNAPEVTGSERLAASGPFDMTAETWNRDRRRVHDTLPPERIKQYFPDGFPSNYDGRYTPIANDWHTKYPTAENRFMQEPFSERLAKIDQIFYGGTNRLARPMEQVVREHNHRCLENKFGVIGEERERLRENHMERLGLEEKLQPPVMSVEEADKMDEAEAAKPLMVMSFETLLRHKHQSNSGTTA